MGKHRKNVVGEAVSELRHFLVGAAFVLVLVTVVPALAQFPGGDMGGGAPPAGGGMPPPPPGGDMGGGAPIGGAPIGGVPTGGAPTGGQMGDPSKLGGFPVGEIGDPSKLGGFPVGEMGDPSKLGDFPQNGQNMGGDKGQFGDPRQGGPQMGGDKGNFQPRGKQMGGDKGQFRDPRQGGKQNQGSFGKGRPSAEGEGEMDFPGQGFGVEGGFPGQGKGVEGGFPGKGKSPQKGGFVGNEGGQPGEPMEGSFGQMNQQGGRQSGRGGRGQFGGQQQGGQEMGGGFEGGFGQAPSPILFDPQQMQKQGFMDKELMKFFGKKPAAPSIQLPEVSEEGASIEEDAGKIASYVETLLTKGKKFKIKKLRQDAVAFYSTVAQWCAEEEVDCGDELAELKFAIRKGSKNSLLETLKNTWESVQEKVLSGGEEEFEGEEGFLEGEEF